MLYLLSRLAEIVEEHVKPGLRAAWAWSRSHEEALGMLLARLRGGAAAKD